MCVNGMSTIPWRNCQLCICGVATLMSSSPVVFTTELTDYPADILNLSALGRSPWKWSKLTAASCTNSRWQTSPWVTVSLWPRYLPKAVRDAHHMGVIYLSCKKDIEMIVIGWIMEFQLITVSENAENSCR